MWLCPDRPFRDLPLWYVVVVWTAHFHRCFSVPWRALTVHGEMDFNRSNGEGFQPRQVRDERVVLSILFGEPRMVKVPSFVGAKPTFQQGCMGSICRVVDKECSHLASVVFVM